MLVVVIAVQGVLVPAMDVVDVIAVLNGLMPAVRTVLVLGKGVLSHRFVLVVVIAVQGMLVPVMDIVDVIAVLNGLVPAIRTVLMFGDSVLGLVGVGGRHDFLLLCGGVAIYSVGPVAESAGADCTWTPCATWARAS